MVDIVYAVQTCDTNSWQASERYAGTKSEIVQKCINSFFKSVGYAAKKRPNSNHTIVVHDDGSTQQTVDSITKCAAEIHLPNVQVTFKTLQSTGIASSIKSCYETLEESNANLVYQVQDDYLFTESAVFEMIDVFMQLKIDCNTDAIVSPFHDHRYWKTIYRYAVTPRMIFPAALQNWMQIYDIPCTFLTSKNQFSKHWDLYYKFFELIGKTHDLENTTLNKMFVERGVLGVQPFTSVALHLQDEVWKDPYIDWKERWNSV